LGPVTAVTLAPALPAGARLTREQAKILAHYAAGESAKSITVNTGLSMAVVGQVLDEHAGNDRDRATQLTLEYQEHARMISAAKGQAAAAVAAVCQPARAAAAVPKPAAPAGDTAETAPSAASPQEPDSPAAEQPVDGIDAVLAQAAATGVPRLQRAAAKVQDLADELRRDLAEHTRETQLRAELARLESRLAEVKQQLRPRRAAAPLAAASTPAVPAVPDSGEAAVDTKAVRAWALEQGLDCPARGRIPGAVTDAYRLAHPAAAVSR
jgi:Lsr2